MLLRWLGRPPRVASLVVFVILTAIGFLPLFGGPGYEHALASGLLLPSAAAISAAVQLSAEDGADPLACVGRGLATGGTLALVAFATALLHGLRVGMCDLAGGALIFALTAGCGALLGGLWGSCVGEVCRGRKRRRLLAVLLALAAPLAGVVVSIARFYGSPMVFSYDPFFGYFSGTLYDTVVDVRPELWSYRGGTLSTIAGAALLASALARTPGGGLRWVLSPGSITRSVLGVGCLAVSLGVGVEGPALGHWQTAETIAQALGGHERGSRCEVFYPDSVLKGAADRMLRDCEQDVAADEAKLGAHLGGPLREFVFRDANEKRRLMGAAETSIAKPWRREVYVQMASFPHPILGHEVAHVVAGSFGHGPFRIAGSLGGLLPDPGLIEGTAVATSPDDDELTDGQWARAMLDLGILPPMRSLFSLGFLGQNASKSYTAAGAFVEWVIERWGAPVVRGWYGGQSLEALTGKTWTELEGDFRTYLTTLSMPAEASAYAKARFERPSVWARHCPHVVDALDRRADQCRDERRLDRALSLYGDAMSRDPHDWHARFESGRIRMLFYDQAGSEDLTRLAADPDAPRPWRDRAREALADLKLAGVAGGGDDPGREARAAYEKLAASVLDEDAARTLEVKALAAQGTGRAAIADLLVGEPGRGLDAWLGGLSLGRWVGASNDPLAQYLVGKNLANHEDFAGASAALDQALAAGAPTPRIGRELLRMRAVCACALGDQEALGKIAQAVQAPGSPFEGTAGGRKTWLLRLVARCHGA
jgi:hypothetical protein